MSNSEEVSIEYGVPRVLIYCQDSFGHGHLQLHVNVAHAIDRLDPDAIILLITDS